MNRLVSREELTLILKCEGSSLWPIPYERISKLNWTTKDALYIIAAMSEFHHGDEIHDIILNGSLYYYDIIIPSYTREDADKISEAIGRLTEEMRVVS